MIITLILLALIALGCWITNADSWNFPSIDVGIFICFCSFVLLCGHLAMWSIAGYEFEKFAMERAYALKTTWGANNWNLLLDTYKHDNRYIIYDSYIDDRIDSLKYIQDGE